MALSEVVAVLESGSRPAGGVSEASGEIPSVGAEHLADDGGFNFSKVKRIPRAYFGSMRAGIIKPHDILIVKDGATTGKVSFVNGQFPFQEAAVNEHVFVLRINKTRANPDYVFRYLYSNQGQLQILKDFRGATVGGISRNFVNRVMLPLPSTSEQRRIAAILDKADAIRRKRRQALAETDTLLRSIFLDMFGDCMVNPKQWDVKRLDEIRDRRRMITYGIVQAGPHVDNGIPYIRTSDFEGDEIKSDGFGRTSSAIAARYRRSTVYTGDLVFCIRATVGSVGIVPDFLNGANLTQGTAVIPPGEGVAREYLVWALRQKGTQKWIERRQKGATFKEITLQTLRDIPIPVPPLEIQQNFAAFTRRFEAAQKVKKAAILEAESLFYCLTGCAFRGEL